MRTLCACLGAALLLGQIGMIVRARYVSSRYYCWAPYDQQGEFEIHASLDGRELDDAEVQSRYRLAKRGVDERSMQHVFDIVSQYEETYARAAPASVRIDYTINGGEEKSWTWPNR